MVNPLRIAVTGDKDLSLLPSLANRHGLITGATGTGKTVTLQVMAEQFSSIGVPVFVADVKGDLAGISQAGQLSQKLKERLDRLGIPIPDFRGSPVTLWDVLGTRGHPLRATVSDMGPLLLSRMLGLNETQEGVLHLVFKIADEYELDGKRGLLLLDAKDLRAILQFVGDNAQQFTTEYGNVSAASVGAIQRGLLTLDSQGANRFFGEPMLDLWDMIQLDSAGRGSINILAADQLLNAPRLYASFLLWLLSELFEQLPEVGDLEKPRFVFFFDEAHLLFNEAPRALLDKVEQVVRLVRSKGVGIYFVTQNPLDIPDTVLGQLGNRVQHALRAFTPRDQRAVKSAAETMRVNPKFDAEKAITELGVGEALISFLDEKGRPNIVERGFVVPPSSRIGPITEVERTALVVRSRIAGKYETTVDNESAYERLKRRHSADGVSSTDARSKKEQGTEPSVQKGSSGGSIMDTAGDLLRGTGRKDSIIEATLKSLARAVGSSLGREIIRGVLGGIRRGAPSNRLVDSESDTAPIKSTRKK